jgi:HSP20 family protein
MNMRDLIPRGRNNPSAPVSTSNEAYRGEPSPFLQLHREMNRLFDDMFRGFDGGSFGALSPSTGNWPGVEVSENDKELKVTAELPGVDQKDIDIALEDNVLILRGEKRSESEDRERQFSERYYGRFERRLPLAVEVDQAKVAASFKDGVLTITLPKLPMSESRVKRIPINGSTTTH